MQDQSLGISNITPHKFTNHYRAAKFLSKFFLHLVLIIGGLIMVFPLIWMIVSSFKPSLEVISVDFHFLPRVWTLRNYVRVFKEVEMARGYLNSIIVSSAVTILVLLTATASGYMFAKLRFRGRDLLFFLVLASVMIPPQIVLIPLYFLINKFGWIDTYQGLIFPFAMNAFGIFLMRQFMYGIPNDLIDAARIDGASDFRIYFSIIIPLVRSSIAVLGILIFLWTWDELLWPLVVVHRNEMKTLPLILAHFTQAEQQFPGESLAASTLVIGPVLIVYAFFQRHFVRGLSMTGLKG
ncbi:MAG: carbohydrate ABC transporter permease [Spirochaetes bacterium]|nr:MAG: carbohydrate ABC transporter permease [Spirochaetota bacterium]